MPYANKEDGKKKVRDKQTEYRVIARKWKCDYLSTHSCVDCKESDPVVLDFDHVRGKKFANISVLIRRGQTLRIILREVLKCAVRCANCHRRRTAERLQPRGVVDSATLS